MSPQAQATLGLVLGLAFGGSFAAWMAVMFYRDEKWSREMEVRSKVSHDAINDAFRRELEERHDFNARSRQPQVDDNLRRAWDTHVPAQPEPDFMRQALAEVDELTSTRKAP